MGEIVSVIVPVYNTKKEYLKKCIDSLVNQTYPQFEILIIDDGSQEYIASYCDEQKKIDNRIKVFHKENGGVSSARNLGLQKCSGTYVTFVDSDDWVGKDFLEILVAGVREEGTDLVICNISLEQNDDYEEDETSEGINSQIYIEKIELYSKMLNEANISGYLCNKLFKKELIKQKLDETLHFSEDFVFCLCYIQNIKKAKYCEKILYHYRQNCENVTQNISYNSRIYTLLNAYEKVREIYMTHSPENLDIIEKNILKIALNLKARYYLSKSDCLVELQNIKTTINKYFVKTLTNRNVTFVEKINILATWLCPRIMLRMKSRILGRK